MEYHSCLGLHRLTVLGMQVLALRPPSFRVKRTRLYYRHPFGDRWELAKTDWSVP